MSESLYSIAVEKDPVLLCHSPDLLCGLDHAGFVVGCLYRNQFGVGLYGAGDCFGLNDPVSVRRNQGAAAAVLFGSLDHRAVFDSGQHNVLPAMRMKNPVVCLCSARCKEQLIPVAADGLGKGLFGETKFFSGFSGFAVSSGRIGGIAAHACGNRLYYLRSGRCGGCMIQINVPFFLLHNHPSCKIMFPV